MDEPPSEDIRHDGPHTLPAPSSIAEAHVLPITDEPMLPPITNESMLPGRRLRQSRRLPARFQDYTPVGISLIVGGLRANAVQLPESLTTSTSSSNNATSLPPSLPRRIYVTGPRWQTPRNLFGMSREYPVQPSHIPDLGAEIGELLLPTAQLRLCDEPRLPDQIDQDLRAAVQPFPNLTCFLFHQFFVDSAVKSKAEESRLLGLMRDPLWKAEDLIGFNPNHMDDLLLRGDIAHMADGHPPVPPGGRRWVETSVYLDIPLNSNGKGHVRSFEIKSLYYRPLIQVIQSSLGDESILANLHLVPYKSLYQAPGSGGFTRIYDEIYTTDTMINEHAKLQRSPPEPDCQRERVILALMFASDATHTSNFGQSKVWPLYLFYGNTSKYHRCKPGSTSAEHVAYIPSVSSTTTICTYDHDALCVSAS
jgi:hypothetical protein